MGALEQIQNETLTILSGLLVRGQHVALVDFPNHENSGDSLIFLGQLKYLEKLGVQVDYIADASRYSPSDLQARVPNGPILIQGGGNFGDRWEFMQAMRERVISDFPDRQIIQLPQGIDFHDGPRLEQAQRILNAHPSLTLMIRDHAGVERTGKLFPNATVVFCPDMAFGYGTVRAGDAHLDAVVLRREDSESLSEGFVMPPMISHEDLDWGLTGLNRILARFLRLPGAVAKRVPALALTLYPVQRLAYLALATINVRHAVGILSRGRLVVTDRLHATVLAALMEKPVIAMDNANGKVSAIVHDYLGRMPGVHFAPGVEHAQDFVVAAISDGTRR